MPLTLNLLHEEQKQLQARQRDPLKLGLLALVGVALLFMGYYVYRLVSEGSTNNELRVRQAEWNRQKPLADAAEAQEVELNKTLVASRSVTQRVEGRFYWGPVLEILQRTVPNTVQVTSFNGNNDLISEKVVLGLEGLAAGPEPRAAAERLRIGLVESLGKQFADVAATFRSLEDTPNLATVDGKAYPTAKFSIEVQLKKTAPVATAAPARPKR